MATVERSITNAVSAMVSFTPMDVMKIRRVIMSKTQTRTETINTLKKPPGFCLILFANSDAETRNLARGPLRKETAKLFLKRNIQPEIIKIPAMARTASM